MLLIAVMVFHLDTHAQGYVEPEDADGNGIYDFQEAGAAPVITMSPPNISTCEGSGILFASNATGSNISARWQISTNNGATFNYIASAGVAPSFSGYETNSLTVLNIPFSLDDAQFRVVYFSDGFSCDSTISTAAVLTVNPTPAAPTGDGIQTFCPSVSTDIDDLVASAGAETIIWYNSDTGGSVLPGNTSLVDGESYFAGYTSGGCPSDRLEVEVSLVDNVDPVVTCLTDSVYLDASGNASINTLSLVDAMSDNCGLKSFVDQTITYDCSDLAVHTVPITVEDIEGNTASCDATVHVFDSLAPSVTCTTPNISLLSSGTRTIVASDVTTGLGDNCSSYSVTLSPNSFDCTDVSAGTIDVTVTVEDAASNVSTCTAVVDIVDNLNPIVTCQDYTLDISATGSGTISAANVVATQSDNCGINTTIVSPNTFNTSNIGSNTLTVTATDDAGNSGTCTSTVTVIGNLPPTAICQDFSLTLDASGNATLTPANIDNGSSDDNGVLNFSLSQTSFDCSHLGTNSVTLTVTDEVPNSSTCTANVEVVDNTVPNVVCNTTTVNFALDDTGNLTLTPSDLTTTLSDNCGISSSSLSQSSFDCSHLGTRSITVTAQDAASNMGVCVATIGIIDDTDPVVTCQDYTLDVTATGSGTISTANVVASQSDNCGINTTIVSPNTFNTSNIGSNTVTVTSTDNAGNSGTCTATVTVVGNAPPVAICQDFTLNLDGTGNATLLPSNINNGSTDDNGILNFSLSQTNFDCSHKGINSVTLTVTDDVPSSSTCTADVNVVDVTPPVANCQGITVTTDASGVATITASMVNNGSTDNCTLISNVNVSPFSFNSSQLGVNTVTLNLEDQAGNTSSCAADVIVLDGTAPEAICQDVAFYLDEFGSVTINATDIDDGSSDNVGITSYTLDQNTFDCSNLTSASTVTLTVSDAQSNTDNCTATVSILDTISPALTCLPVNLYLDDAGAVNFNASDIVNITTNCNDTTVAISASTFDCSAVGSTQAVTVDVVDNSGNSNSCVVDVTVLDTVSIKIACQDHNVSLDGSGNAMIIHGDVILNIEENCTSVTPSLSQYTFTTADLGANTITATATNENGETATCTSIVTVSDAGTPVALCQNLTVPLDATGNASITPAQVDNGSNDNVGITSTTLDQTSFTCSELGSNTVTLTVTDDALNTSSCTATIEIVDNLAPTITCIDHTIALDNSGVKSLTNSQLVTSTDNCGVNNVTASQNDFDCSNVGDNTVSVEVTDVNGNSSTCNANVVVFDNVGPQLTCVDITLPLDGTGNAVINTGDVTSAIVDDCGVPASSVTPFSFNNTNIGVNSVLVEAEDPDGNTSTCTAQVTITVSEIPNAQCQNITIALDAVGNASIVPSQIDNGSTDNVGITSMTLSQTAFDCSHAGDNTVTLSVDDADGNVGTCDATVTVEDNQVPTLTCADAILYLDTSGEALLDPSIVVESTADNCSIQDTILSQTLFTNDNIGSNSINIQVSDVNGNTSTCLSTVLVEDTISPNAICQDITVALDEFGQYQLNAVEVDNGSSDNVGFILNSDSDPLYTCADIGINAYALIVEDLAGNTDQCTAQVTVIDNLPPVLTCSDITVILDVNGEASIVPSDVSTSSDNCSTVTTTLSQTDFTIVNLGENIVTVTATDGTNVSTCDATVTVSQDASTIASCQDVTVALNQGGEANVTPLMINDGSSAGSGVASMTVDNGLMNCANLGSNTITLTVIANNGSSATCTSNVEVIDEMAPMVTCPGIQMVTTNSNCEIVVGDYTALAIANDNCSVSTITQSPAPGTVIDGSVETDFTITITAIDVASNTATCTFSLGIIDDVVPTITCPGNISYVNDEGQCEATVPLVLPTVTDNCIYTITNSYNSDVSQPTVLSLGYNAVVWTVTDLGGNTVTCTQEVDVVDNQPPNINCPGDLATNDNVVVFDAPLVLDNCSANIIQVDGPAPGSVFDAGVTSVTFLATDDAGLMDECTFNILVNTPPVAISDSLINTQVVGSSTIDPLVNDYDPDGHSINVISASSNIGQVSVVDGQYVSFTMPDLWCGVAIINYTIEDELGATASAFITVEYTCNDEFFLPEAFSPNGDGINDKFEIIGVEKFPECELNIYNRWGRLVYETVGYDNSWDGSMSDPLTFGQKTLPQGTYFYNFRAEPDGKIYKGFFFLSSDQK